MQFSLLYRIKEYYTDLKCEKHHELFRPGNVLWVLFGFVCSIMSMFPIGILYAGIKQNAAVKDVWVGFIAFFLCQQLWVLYHILVYWHHIY